MDRPTLLLAGGALVGVVLAASGILNGFVASTGSVPVDAAVLVNGQSVRRVDYERMVVAVAGDKRGPMRDEDRRRVLDRLIEEELLVQRALELGLAYHDSRVRKDLTAVMLDSIAAEARDAQPSDEQLQQFYEDQKEFFASSEQVRVRQIWFRIANLADSNAAYDRARAAAERLNAGEAFEAVQTSGDAEIAPLPDALMPPGKLADYLGPTPLRAVINLEPGQVTEPIRSSSGYHILQLVDRAPAPAPPFEQIRDQVLEAYRRRAADDALRAYLDDLRSRAHIEIAPDLS